MRAHGHYMLHGHEPIPCINLMVWAQWFETADRHVRKTRVRGYEISTVFLGLDHNYGDGEPLLFETLVFGGYETSTWPGSGRKVCVRCTVDGSRMATWDQAVAQHKVWVKLFRRSRRQQKRLDANHMPA